MTHEGTMNQTQTIQQSNTVTGHLSSEDEERIINRISREGGYTADVAKAVFAETVRFLRMIATRQNAPSVPSHMVDEGWHAFILHTRLYQTFCTKEFGRFIHHEPHGEPQRKHMSSKGCAQTVAYMEAHAIPFNPEFWNTGRSGDCSDTCGLFECSE